MLYVCVCICVLNFCIVQNSNRRRAHYSVCSKKLLRLVILAAARLRFRIYFSQTNDLKLLPPSATAVLAPFLRP